MSDQLITHPEPCPFCRVIVAAPRDRLETARSEHVQVCWTTFRLGADVGVDDAEQEMVDRVMR